MERIEAGNAGMNANLGQFEGAFKHFEQRMERTTKKIEASLVRMTGTLEAHLRRLETKLDHAGKTLVALAAQSKETGNALGRFVEALGKASGIGPIEGAGELISLMPGESDDQKAFLEFSKQAPSQLLKEFESRQGHIGSYGSGGDKVVATDAIARIRHEQELILKALLSKAKLIQSQRKSLVGIASNPGMPKNGQAIQDYKTSLQTIRDVFDKIREFAISSELQNLIDSIRPFLNLSPRQTGALVTSPRAHQLVDLGADDSDAVGGSLFRLGGKAGDATRGFIELNEQVARLEAQGGPLAKGLAETNTRLGTQADRLRSLGGLLPDIGHRLIDFFDGGAEGAARLDGAVAAVGERFLDAFEGAILRGESLGPVLKSLARDLANLALQQVQSGELFGGGGCWIAGRPATA